MRRTEEHKTRGDKGPAAARGCTSGASGDGASAREGMGTERASAVPTFVLAVAPSVKTMEAAKVLFLMAEVARKNFAGCAARQRRALTAAFCALAGVIRPSSEHRKLIERELAR